MCEYAHAMGNAIGNLQDYWDEIEKGRNAIGGCIWDWVDQAIYFPQAIKDNTLSKNGFAYYASGYDFPGPHQGNFLNNGILRADRKWNDKLSEVKQVYSYVKFLSFDTLTNTLTLLNKYDFTNLDQFYREFNWQVQSVLLYVVYLIVKNLLDSDSKQITVGIHFRFCVILQLFVICAAGSRIGFLCVSISFESL